MVQPTVEMGATCNSQILKDPHSHFPPKGWVFRAGAFKDLSKAMETVPSFSLYTQMCLANPNTRAAGPHQTNALALAIITWYLGAVYNSLPVVHWGEESLELGNQG